jgi:hypothetical protein
MILDASRFICALLMCLKFQVSKNSQPYTVAAATCSASASAFRGNGPGRAYEYLVALFHTLPVF